MIDISAIAMAAVNVTSGSAPSSNSEFPWSRHQGHIDSQLWRQYRQHCGVRRFWNGEAEQIGRLVHKPGGAEHARWVFDYDAARTDDDEAGYRFGVRDDAGEQHTFRVMTLESAT